MITRAYEHIKEFPGLKQNFHLRCCKLFKDYCVEFYLTPSEERGEDIKEALVNIETNIWECIRRALNKERSIENQDGMYSSRESESSSTTAAYETPGRLDSGSTFRSENSSPDHNLSSLLFEEGKSIVPFNISNCMSQDSDSLIRPEQCNSRDSDESVEATSKDEEFLVIYYATDLIFENKHSDALKAVCDYLQKPDISNIGLANLHRIYAVLLMMSDEYQNSKIALKYFKTASEYYHNCGLSKGQALCMLGMVKVWHDKMAEILQDFNKEELNETGHFNRNNNQHHPDQNSEKIEYKYVMKVVEIVNKANEILKMFNDDQASIQ